MNHRSIKGTALAGVATAALLALAACSSSSTPKATSSGTSGIGTKTLVVESTQQSPITQTFNPFDATSAGTELHSTDLYYEPLYFFNILDPKAQPVPLLSTAYSWSSDGKTL